MLKLIHAIFAEHDKSQKNIKAKASCLRTGIYKKLIIFTTICTNSSHVNKVPRVPDLKNVYCLITKGHNCQQIVIQEDTHVMGQIDIIIVKYLLI